MNASILALSALKRECNSGKENEDEETTHKDVMCLLRGQVYTRALDNLYDESKTMKVGQEIKTSLSAVSFPTKEEQNGQSSLSGHRDRATPKKGFSFCLPPRESPWICHCCGLPEKNRTSSDHSSGLPVYDLRKPIWLR